MKTSTFIAIIVIAFSVNLFSACKKDNKAPREPEKVVQTQTDSTWKIKQVFNYSTTVTAPTNTQQLENEKLDTTYYEIWKNNVKQLSWKMNWTYTSTPMYNNIQDLQTVVPYNKGDTLVWKIIHKSPRSITGYTFNAGITLIQNESKKSWFVGQFSGYSIDSTSPYYEPNRNTFVQIWSGVAE